jgi:hypothetical protein
VTSNKAFPDMVSRPEIHSLVDPNEESACVSEAASVATRPGRHDDRHGVIVREPKHLLHLGENRRLLLNWQFVELLWPNKRHARS